MYSQNYPVSVEWTGEIYFRVSLYWDYRNKHVTLSVSRYVEGAIHEYQQKVQHAPIMHRKNWKYHIMGPKLSGHPMRATNLSSHLRTKKYTKGGRRIYLLCKST